MRETDTGGQRNAGTVCPSETAWQTYYGFDWSTPPVKKAKNGQGLYQVTVYNDYLCSLISVFSLGLAVPQRVEWQAQRPEPKDEKAEPMKPTTRLNFTKAR